MSPIEFESFVQTFRSFKVNYLCKLTDVENDDAIVSNGFRRLLEQLQTTMTIQNPIVIVAAVPKVHMLSEQVLALFNYTFSMPVT